MLRVELYVLFSLLGCAHASQASSAPAVPTASPRAGQLTVEVVGLNSDRGQLQAALFRTADGFPSEPERAFARQVLPIHKQHVRLVFDAVPSGPFAVLAHHDENADGKMEKGLFGMPAEGYAISRDAKASFGPPSFEDAKLVLAKGQHQRIVVHMRY